jgi:hypothetical protein
MVSGWVYGSWMEALTFALIYTLMITLFVVACYTCVCRAFLAINIVNLSHLVCLIYHPIDKILGIAKSRIAEKKVTFKVGNVQLPAEENFAAVPKEEWIAVFRRVKIVEVECKRREHEKESAMERIITSADEDDDDTLHSSHCHDDDVRDGPLSSDS